MAAPDLGRLRDLGEDAPRNEGALSPGNQSPLKIVSRRLVEPSHPLAHKLLAFWAAKRKAGGLLNKSDIPCRAMGDLLPNLFLFEPVDDAGADWRCRVVGSAIRERYGGPNQRGRTLFEDYAPDIAGRRAANYRHVTQSGEPLIMRGRLMNIGRDFYEVEVLNLPVASGTGALWVLGGMFFFE